MAPFSTAEGDLRFEEFEGVIPQSLDWDFEGFLKVVRGFVADEKQCAVGLPASDFLEDAEVVDRAENIAVGVVLKRAEGEWCLWVAELVDFWWVCEV